MEGDTFSGLKEVPADAEIASATDAMLRSHSAKPSALLPSS